MPGYRLDAEETPVPRFSVVGQYARPGRDQFVIHVALLCNECDLAFGQMAEVWHCSPPIIAGSRTSAGSNHKFDQCEVHAVSFIENLSADDVAGIETTLAEIDTQTQPVTSQIRAFPLHYYVEPPIKRIRDTKTGTLRFRKFSCVGFVLECYEEGTGIRLLDLGATDFPAADLETLASAYGNAIRNSRQRERYGINGSGPWQIALAGYVLHALNRPAAAVRNSPHVPNGIAEAEFPLPHSSGGGEHGASDT